MIISALILVVPSFLLLLYVWADDEDGMFFWFWGSVGQFFCLIFLGLIGLLIFGIVLMDYSAPDGSYNINNYDDILTVNNSDIAIDETSRKYDANGNYYLCNITGIIDYKFDQKKIKYATGEDSTETVAKVTYLWLIYNVSVFEFVGNYINISVSIDFNDTRNELEWFEYYYNGEVSK